ncbi:MAG: formate dehydrogenase subunit gamma, partial [Campylobacteraceae bacterium]|nr:formate dehydrogenase subunit gamma [Campylobacteraceae bacterium]
MKRLYIILTLLVFTSLAFASDSAIWGKDMILNIAQYDK